MVMDLLTCVAMATLAIKGLLRTKAADNGHPTTGTDDVPTKVGAFIGS